eukprot:jgi/Chlat1/8818/Chrsp90S08121
MSLTCRRRLPRSEAAAAAAAECGPIRMELEKGTTIVFEKGQWRCEGMQGLPNTKEGVEQELMELRNNNRKQLKELDRLKAKLGERKELQERWNLLDFKYQLLIDMWTMRVLDNEKEQKEGYEMPVTHGRNSHQYEKTASEYSHHGEKKRDSRSHSLKAHSMYT